MIIFFNLNCFFADVFQPGSDAKVNWVEKENTFFSLHKIEKSKLLKKREKTEKKGEKGRDRESVEGRERGQ